jgi:CheY-like chemotaxis protein
MQIQEMLLDRKMPVIDGRQFCTAIETDFDSTASKRRGGFALVALGFFDRNAGDDDSG